jgi:hypothetical protein
MDDGEGGTSRMYVTTDTHPGLLSFFISYLDNRRDETVASPWVRLRVDQVTELVAVLLDAIEALEEE